jgi:hypothetical protein
MRGDRRPTINELEETLAGDEPQCSRPDNVKSATPDMGCCMGRQSARARMQQQVHSMRRRADALQALLDALPAVLPELADAALWEIVTEAERR